MTESKYSGDGGFLELPSPESGSWPYVDEVTLGEGIPTTLLHHGDRVARPLIIFANGFGSNVRQAVPPGEATNRISPPLVAGLLNDGYNIAVPEIPGHGRRRGSHGSPADAVIASLRGTERDVLSLAATEISDVIDDLVGRDYFPIGPIGVLGHSWGGLQSLLRMAGDSRIACGVALIPVVDPTCLKPFADMGDAPVLRSFSLAELSARTLHERPLLVMTGAEDEIAPPGLVENYLRSLEALTSGLNQPAYVRVPGVGHGYHPVMLEHSLDWFRQHLRSAGASLDSQPASTARTYP